MTVHGMSWGIRWLVPFQRVSARSSAGRCQMLPEYGFEFRCPGYFHSIARMVQAGAEKNDAILRFEIEEPDRYTSVMDA